MFYPNNYKHANPQIIPFCGWPCNAQCKAWSNLIIIYYYSTIFTFLCQGHYLLQSIMMTSTNNKLSMMQQNQSIGDDARYRFDAIFSNKPYDMLINKCGCSTQQLEIFKTTSTEKRITLMPPSLRLLPLRNSKDYHLQFINLLPGLLQTIMLVNSWMMIPTTMMVVKINKQKVPFVGKVVMILIVFTAPETRTLARCKKKETFLYNFRNNSNIFPYWMNLDIQVNLTHKYTVIMLCCRC